jgi:hypothetical protein
MNKIIICFTSLLLLLSASNTRASDISYGIGYGLLYSGLGLNINSTSKNQLTYVSIGCRDIDPVNGDTCGAGIGLINTSILSKRNNNHGLGFYLGMTPDLDGYVDGERQEGPFYGVGVGYYLFPSGIDKSGWNFGISYTYTDEMEGSYWLQAGYQF